MAEHISLSRIKPDFESIASQLTAFLNNKASWLTLQRSSTGEILTEAIAMVGEYDQYSIMSAVQETTLENAHLPESVYTNCRFLGVRLSRKQPAHCTVLLQNTNISSPYLEVPIFTQFMINGEKYFNRTPIIFNASNLIIETTLYQGEIKSAYFVSDGSSYQTYTLEESIPWSISDKDIICTIDGKDFARTETPIFLFGMSDAKFYENSLPTGQVECKFGNGIYGIIPQDQSQITFTYAVTNGTEGNNSILEQQVSCSSFPQITGETTSNSYGGGNQPDFQFYKQLGAQAGASNGRGIVRADFKPLVVSFPGVKDCNVYGQAEIAPLDKDWMNVVGLMLLVDETFTNDSWKDLVVYLKSKAIFGLQYKRFDPEPIPVNIDVTIYMKSEAKLSNSRDIALEALQKYFELRLGSLGRGLYASDIDDIILSALPETIDYIDRKSPNINYAITRNQYIRVDSINIDAKYSERDSLNLVNTNF